LKSFINVLFYGDRKMKKMHKVAMVLLVAVMFLFAGMSDLFARGGSRGGGSRSFSRPSSSRTSRPSSSRTSTRSTKPSSSKRTTTAPKRTAAQQKSYEKAKANGTAFKSKSAATSAFKQKNASKYTSTYKTQPATRPSHIPQTTKVGNSNVNVTYNVNQGGYGYMHPTLGTWMMYDAMTDAVMLSMLMKNNHYHYDPVPARPAVVHRHDSGSTVLLTLLIGGAVVVILIVVCTRT
jgi:cytoskeletal protein RodZ